MKTKQHKMSESLIHSCCCAEVQTDTCSMSRAQDLSRVAKGFSKVAQALYDAEGPAVAARCLKLREHGFGLSSSLKDAISSAVSSTAAPGQSPPPDGSTPDNVEKASVPMPNATSDSTAAPLRTSNGSITSHAHSSYSLKYALASDVASVRDGSPIVEGDPAPVRQGIHIEEPKSVAETGGVLGQEGSISVRSSSSSGSSSSSDILGEAKKGEVDTKQEGAGVSASSTEKWDEIGPWAFASEGKDTSKSSTEGVGVSQSGSSNGKNGMTGSRTRSVPSSPLARVFGFGQLAAGLAMGTVAEAIRQNVGGGGVEGGDRVQAGGVKRQEGAVKQYVVSDANAERLAETLCRMRGAALKLGQMLSIQDESVIPLSLAKALDRVRQGADMMPSRQLHKQLEKSLGANWRSKVASFDETPIAAASIGQVHRAKLMDGTEVAMKIQYPGVADSVESDLTNLQRLVQLTNILPPGLYIEEIIKVAREELGQECDYEKEAANQDRFRLLVESDEVLSKWANVPRVVSELSSKEVLTTHLVTGVPVDQVLPMPQEVRNHVARLMLRCTIKELFDWRFMQTDPNWGNFLFDRNTGKMSLIDFGACRDYRKDFVDGYLRLVWSAANRDEEVILKVSKELLFLTGDETPAMMKAHTQAGLVMGEPFVDRDEGAFDFHGSNIMTRLSQHGDTFMKHRLTPPPREAYSLHRKLAGAFLMNIKLKATIPCRDILEEVYDRYTFG